MGDAVVVGVGLIEGDGFKDEDGFGTETAVFAGLPPPPLHPISAERQT